MQLKPPNMQAKFFGSLALAAGLCAGAATRAADNAASAGQLGNPVIARGKGVEITRGDLDEAMAGLKAQVQKLTPAQIIEIQKQVLTNLINTRLLIARATDADRAAGKKTADLQITAMIENVGSPEAFDQRLKTNGLTEAGLRDRLTQDVTARAVLLRELNVTVTDAEVKQFYDLHTADFEQPEMARISHILIFTVDPVTRAALSPEQLNARRRLADSLVRAARAGDDFGKLAQQYSEDPGTKSAGGELPPFPRGQMVHEIDDAAFALTNNQISDVITTATGYQIIKLLEKIPSKKMDYLAAAARIKEQLAREKTVRLEPAYLSGLRQEAGVEILDPNLNAAPATGAGATPSGP